MKTLLPMFFVLSLSMPMAQAEIRFASVRILCDTKENLNQNRKPCIKKDPSQKISQALDKMVRDHSDFQLIKWEISPIMISYDQDSITAGYLLTAQFKNRD